MLSKKYLRPQDLRRLRNFGFAPRRVIEGQYAGRHATPQRGQSVEFRDFRQYFPGDDLGSVDWKVYGRTDKLFIKVFEHQASMTVNLLVDASASMAFRGVSGSGLSKYDQACFLAAAIAFLVANQQDRVSLAFAKDGLYDWHRPTSSLVKVSDMIGALERSSPSTSTRNGARPARLADSLRDLAAASSRRCLFIVLSDLLENQTDLLRSLSLCSHRGGEVMVMHVMHHEELRLPAIEHGVFIDSEDGRRVRLHVDDIRAAYDKRMSEFLNGWRRICVSRGVDYRLVSTDVPYHQALERHLFQRAAMR